MNRHTINDAEVWIERRDCTVGVEDRRVTVVQEQGLVEKVPTLIAVVTIRESCRSCQTCFVEVVFRFILELRSFELPRNNGVELFGGLVLTKSSIVLWYGGRSSSTCRVVTNNSGRFVIVLDSTTACGNTCTNEIIAVRRWMVWLGFHDECVSLA